MLEIITIFVAHPQLLHDSSRPQVDRRREGYDLFELQSLEAVGGCRLRGLGRIAAAPISLRQPPADLDGRGEKGPQRGRPKPHAPPEHTPFRLPPTAQPP